MISVASTAPSRSIEPFERAPQGRFARNASSIMMLFAITTSTWPWRIPQRSLRSQHMRDLLAWKQFDAARGWMAETRTSADGATTTTTLLGPPTTTSAPFTEAVPSWSAATPAGAWIEVQLRARRGARWTEFYRVAEWDSLGAGSRRHSFDAQRDADGRVATDTLILNEPADAIQLRVLLHTTAGQPAELRALQIALSGPGAGAVERG